MMWYSLYLFVHPLLFICHSNWTKTKNTSTEPFHITNLKVYFQAQALNPHSASFNLMPTCVFSPRFSWRRLVMVAWFWRCSDSHSAVLLTHSSLAVSICFFSTCKVCISLKILLVQLGCIICELRGLQYWLDEDIKTLKSTHFYIPQSPWQW